MSTNYSLKLAKQCSLYSIVYVPLYWSDNSVVCIVFGMVYDQITVNRF